MIIIRFVCLFCLSKLYLNCLLINSKSIWIYFHFFLFDFHTNFSNSDIDIIHFESIFILFLYDCFEQLYSDCLDYQSKQKENELKIKIQTVFSIIRFRMIFGLKKNLRNNKFVHFLHHQWIALVGVISFLKSYSQQKRAKTSIIKN